MAVYRTVIGCCKAGWARTDNSNFLTCCRIFFWNPWLFSLYIPICNKTFHIINCYRRVNQVTSALCLTGMWANPSTDNWERILFFNHLHCCFKITITCMSKISLNINVCRASHYTRSDNLHYDRIEFVPDESFDNFPVWGYWYISPCPL